MFLRAADLLTTTWRETINASTMLNQSKTVHQSEIDAVARCIDFLRFNVHFAAADLRNQPILAAGHVESARLSSAGRFRLRRHAIQLHVDCGTNLSAAPAIMGNTVIWKPASSTVYSNYYICKSVRSSRTAAGSHQFCCRATQSTISDVLLNHSDLGGIHFTGSTEVFQTMWRTVGENIAKYKSYPRLVGETGGKDFILAHASADPDALITAIVRGGFEYQGQKCSAASRVYVPDTLWNEIKDRLIETINSIPMGDVADFRNFMGAVIDRNSFKKLDRISSKKRGARRCSDHRGRRSRRFGRILCSADADSGEATGLSNDVRRAVRAGRHAVRLSGKGMAVDAVDSRQDLALRIDRRRVFDGPGGRSRTRTEHCATLRAIST